MPIALGLEGSANVSISFPILSRLDNFYTC